MALNADDTRDLDETRRLLYMALLVGRTKRYNLAGTLVNALVHHHAASLDIRVVTDHVVNVVEGNDETGSRAWLQEQVDRITQELSG